MLTNRCAAHLRGHLTYYPLHRVTRSPARLLGLLILALLPGTAAAQSYALSDTTLPEVNFGALLQTTARLQHTPSSSNPNGFRARRMRLKLSGRASETVDYVFQTEFVGSPALLDAQINWGLADDLTLHVGRYKPPFSAEQLGSSSRLDFTDRSRVVRTLAPARQVGLDLEADAGVLTVRGGVFNGSSDLRNDNDLLFYVGRAEADLSTDAFGLEVAANAAASRDDGLRVRGIYDDFTGRRTLFGADFRLSVGPARLSGEWIHAVLEPNPPTGLISSGLEQHDAWGAYLTAAYDVVPGVAQVLARWDHLDVGTDPYVGPIAGPDPATDLLLLGGAWRPDDAVRLLVSYMHPLGSLHPEARAIEGMLQVSF